MYALLGYSFVYAGESHPYIYTIVLCSVISNLQYGAESTMLQACFV